jgi:adenosylhomocysteine nucleosidase
MIAVVCAVPAERRALAGLADDRLTLHLSGIGAAAAARTAGTIVEGGSPEAIVSAGFCGGLAEDLRVGDLVAADEVLDERTGDRFPADPRLLAAAPGRRGVIVSAERIARTPADRARLDGFAVDMESAALARAAAAAGVPFLALRAVTDERRHRLPDFDKVMDAAGRLTPGAGMIHFVLHPRELPALMRLGPAARRASEALREGMAGLLGALR